MEKGKVKQYLEIAAGLPRADQEFMLEFLIDMISDCSMTDSVRALHEPSWGAERCRMDMGSC